MKNLAIFLSLFVSLHAYGQRTLTKLWETPPQLKVPESVLLDKKAKLLYVSNIGGGAADGKDLKGSIAKVDLYGNILEAEWIKGLKAPKGLGKYGSLLYVADIDEVVVMDVKKGAIVNRIPIAGAKMLNDITVDKKGTVYVSDTRDNKIYKIVQGKPTLVLDNIKSVNGLLAVKKNLYIMADGGLHLLPNGGQVRQITSGIEGFADGIEQVKPNEFIVTGWEGTIYYVDAQGNKQLLSDTRKEKISAADLGYNAAKRIVYIPTFRTNTVVAYELK